MAAPMAMTPTQRQRKPECQENGTLSMLSIFSGNWLLPFADKFCHRLRACAWRSTQRLYFPSLSIHFGSLSSQVFCTRRSACSRIHCTCPSARCKRSPNMLTRGKASKQHLVAVCARFCHQLRFDIFSARPPLSQTLVIPIHFSHVVWEPRMEGVVSWYPAQVPRHSLQPIFMTGMGPVWESLAQSSPVESS